MSGGSAARLRGIPALKGGEEVNHSVREIDKRGGMRRLSAGPGTSVGTVDFETGVYYTAAAAMTEAERRAAGLRRNGQPRRKTDTR